VLKHLILNTSISFRRQYYYTPLKKVVKEKMHEGEKKLCEQ
jgi:hypothetical protein